MVYNKNNKTQYEAVQKEGTTYALREYLDTIVSPGELLGWQLIWKFPLLVGSPSFQSDGYLKITKISLRIHIFCATCMENLYHIQCAAGVRPARTFHLQP